jgi:hypothetical protein
MNRFLVFGIICVILLVACKSEDCSEISMIKIFEDRGINGNDTSYKHYVYARGANSTCWDSLTAMNSLNSFLDTIKGNHPIFCVKIYSDISDFDMGETGQDWKVVDRACLVEIFLSGYERKVLFFRFYNQDGEIYKESKSWIDVSAINSR